MAPTSDEFYALLKVSEERVLDGGAGALQTMTAAGAYDLIVLSAPDFARVDDVASVLAAAAAALAPTGRFAFDYPNPHGPLAVGADLPPAEVLDQLLVEAGLEIHERYGDFDRGPFTAHSPSIITLAGRT